VFGLVSDDGGGDTSGCAEHDHNGGEDKPTGAHAPPPRWGTVGVDDGWRAGGKCRVLGEDLLV
jgi:hypothetical protein